MRRCLFTATLLLSASSAMAQSSTPYPAQQEANVSVYSQVPTIYPQTYAVPAPQPAQPQPQYYYEPHQIEPAPALINDVRQMNF